MNAIAEAMWREAGSDSGRAERRARRLGWALALVGVVGGGVWSGFAPLGSAALAPGVVAVAGHRKTVQHLEGGIVREIAVQDGRRVARGDLLLALDPTAPQTELELVRGELFAALARQGRLVAQRDALPAVVHADRLVAARDRDARAAGAMAAQDRLFAARRSALDGEAALYRRQIEQLQAQIAGFAAQKAGRDRLVESYGEEVRDFTILLEEGYAEKQKVRELERNRAQQLGQQGELAANIAAARLKIGELELKTLQLQKDFQREVATELGEVDAKVAALTERLGLLEDTLRRTEVRAPEAGMVLGLAVHTVGAVLPAGARILDIVPEDGALVVEAQVAPQDIDRVHAGLRAEVRFTAFKRRETPRLEGELVDVSADRLIDEGTEHRPYYLARVAVDAAALRALAARHLDLKPGMPAEILIDTGSRTLLQYLTQPLGDVLARSLIED
ncbi:MAG: HlyD family type I secretion periplasmic adaptor subunit [Gammaproteobacteria bacterium]|nr:HlyD family type I secretion periplasmic adaptor subunit [Gammaproteobacteria bacterium]MBI5616028.1 HlyD family type I secretion periplasmic adaptor subunit [Gammaproteobacteria bacterium]